MGQNINGILTMTMFKGVYCNEENEINHEIIAKHGENRAVCGWFVSPEMFLQTMTTSPYQSNIARCGTSTLCKGEIWISYMYKWFLSIVMLNHQNVFCLIVVKLFCV